MPQRLRKKRCLIVGGTSGLGLAAARRFVEEGAEVVVAGLPPESSAEGTITHLPEVGRGCILTDVRQALEVDKLFADALKMLAGLDVLYHVAGTSGRRWGDGPVHECTEEGWRATLDANLTTTFFSNRAAVRHFLERRQTGVILNMASVLGFSPAPRYFDTCAYAAAKAAVIAFSRHAAARYAAEAIRVNVIAPGLIDTPMAQRAVQDQAIVQYLKTKQPLRGGPGLPEDCSDAAVFLCRDEARFITGAVLPVDGGWSVS